MQNLIDLTGKSALVTGGGQGLGHAIAQRLFAAGARVAINYFPDDEQTHRRLAEQAVSELGDRAITAPADVRSYDQTLAMVQSVADQWGGLDILVNNAGILRDRTVKNMTPQQWQDVIDTNLTGVFNASKAAATRMADDGRIISISSIAAKIGFFGQANYAAAKAGIISLTRVLSRELARSRITVNAVAPGVVLTEMGKSIPPENREIMLREIPLGRFAEPDEIAGVVLFLASEWASYITGQTLHVNGGWWA